MRERRVTREATLARRRTVRRYLTKKYPEPYEISANYSCQRNTYGRGGFFSRIFSSIICTSPLIHTDTNRDACDDTYKRERFVASIKVIDKRGERILEINIKVILPKRYKKHLYLF